MKSRMKYYFVSAFFVFAVSCGIQKPEGNSKHNSNEEIGISPLSTFPEEIDGCSCAFSASKEQYEKNIYIFASNYDSLGFMTLNNERQILRLRDSGRDEFSFGDYDHTDIFENENYIVTVDMKYKESSGDETWINTGTITVENKNGDKKSTKLFGECGC